MANSTLEPDIPTPLYVLCRNLKEDLISFLYYSIVEPILYPVALCLTRIIKRLSDHG